MKKVSIVSLVTIMMIVISSCGSSNNVVNNHGITKRKYNRGFFVQRNSNMRTANSEVKEERANAEKTLAMQDKVAKRAQKESVKQKMNVEQTVALENTASHSTVYAAEAEQRGSIAANERSSDDAGISEQETSVSVSRETIDRQPISDRNESNKKQSKSAAGGGSGVHIIILVILAIIIPPLAVFLFEGVTTRFWIDLILALLGYGIGFGIGGLFGLLGLIAVIYALLIVLGAI